MIMRNVATGLAMCLSFAVGFQPSYRPSTRFLVPLHASIGGDEQVAVEDDSQIQWELFKKHHVKGSSSSWKGIWTTYDYIGDVQMETVASVNYQQTSEDSIEKSHTIVVGAKRSDCATCFDSMETKDIPVATYTPSDLKKSRFGACGMVNGPSLLRNGAMATELVLSHGDGRVRVVFQHAPVWEKGVEPGSCPPQGLKLFRTLISREALRSTAPTAETEAADPPSPGNPIFYRPVAPFNWHKKWGGTSWTWGPQAGNRGWSIEELDEEEDAWHGSAPTEVWNLRLPGGIFVQTPRVVTDLGAALCRLAWLPDDETLLRMEVGVMALQPMVMEDDNLAGFEPPTLASLRCDVLNKLGDLEGQPSFVKDQAASAQSQVVAEAEKEINTSESKTKEVEKKAKKVAAKKDSDKPLDSMDAIKNSLQL